MNLTPEQQTKRLFETREAAAAFVEDIADLRKILEDKNHRPSEVRRASVVMRRLINYNDLSHVAAPRIGKLLLSVPDLRTAYRVSEKSPFWFFQWGGVEVFGNNFTSLALFKGDARNDSTWIVPNEMVSVRLDNYMHQRVISFDGQWATRAQVIDYIANYAAAAHTAAADTPVTLMLRQCRSVVKFGLFTTKEHNDTFQIRTQLDAMMRPDETVFEFGTSSFDPVLVELLASMKFLANSPDVASLEEVIRDELGLTSHA